MTHAFRSMHHLCVVVKDVDRAMKFYENIGIGPWYEYPPLSEYTQLDVPDRHGFLGLRYVYTNIGEVQLQLVQPSENDSPQRRFLEQTGGGVFHVGFSVEDVDTATAEVERLGVRRWMTGRRPDRSGFAYFRTRDEAGVTLEVRQSSGGASMPPIPASDYSPLKARYNGADWHA